MKNTIRMKNSLYVFAGLLIIIWAIVFFVFDSYSIYSFQIVHILLLIALFLILIRVILNKKLTGK